MEYKTSCQWMFKYMKYNIFLQAGISLKVHET